MYMGDGRSVCESHYVQRDYYLHSPLPYCWNPRYVFICMYTYVYTYVHMCMYVYVCVCICMYEHDGRSVCK